MELFEEISKIEKDHLRSKLGEKFEVNNNTKLDELFKICLKYTQDFDLEDEYIEVFFGQLVHLIL